MLIFVHCYSYQIENSKSFNEKVGFWIKNIQLKIPESVVLLVGTHVDQCTDETEVKEKKKEIEEKVTKMLETHKSNLDHQRENLQNMEDPSLYSDQINQILRLTEYKLKVIWFCSYCYIKHASKTACSYDPLISICYQVLELVPIDCTKPEDIDKLHTHIREKVLNKDTFPNMEQTLPRCYHEVENDIKEFLKNGDIPEHGLYIYVFLFK